MNERPIEPDFSVAQDDGEFRTRQPFARLAPLGDVFIARQELQAAVQIAGTLERADDIGIFGQKLPGLKFAHADCLALQIVIAQHQPGHLVRHLHQQPIARRLGDFAGAHRAIEENLQIDFDIRTNSRRRNCR